MEATVKTNPIENESFWKSHYNQQLASGIKRSKYCRQHNLNYNRFRYWIDRLNLSKKDSKELISIKLKSNEPTSNPDTPKTLCTLTLNNGHSLKIHDERTLAIILERCC